MSEPRFRIPRFYKTLLALSAVIGPMYWLLFTADGQRRTDIALMWLLDRPAFDAALEAFDERLDESRLRASFPALDLQCSPVRGPFGDRACVAPIGSFNQYPASSLTLYFQGQQAVAAKVVYQRAYHESIRGWVERRAARAGETAAIADAGRGAESGTGERGVPRPAMGDGAVTWEVKDGVLAMKKGSLGNGDEPALLWLSTSALSRLKTSRVP